MTSRLPDETSLLGEVKRYYTAKLAEHGATARGVDWNGDEGQMLRFEQLVRIIGAQKDFSVNDIGCGYGAMFAFLRQRYASVDYNGCDISAEMVAAGQAQFGEDPKVTFVVGADPVRLADYGFASGIFNVRLERTDSEWQSYMIETLDLIARTSRHGFSFNCLTSYSDAERMRPNLYYASPSEVFDLCRQRYSRNVALLHDYGLYEFTILVRNNL